MIKYYDVDGDGNVGYEEFLNGLRDPLTQRKQAIVDRAFATLDKKGSGSISASDIAGIFDCTRNPDVVEGKKTADQVLTDFLNSFDGMRGNSDGSVSKQEWD